VTAIRTCVGCGARAPRATLLRFVARDGALRPDPAMRLAGRGAWLHREPACHAAFVARRGAIRSLRATPARAVRAALVAALHGPEGRA